MIDVLQVKYLNNIIEQPFRDIAAPGSGPSVYKELTKQMRGFKALDSATEPDRLHLTVQLP